MIKLLQWLLGLSIFMATWAILLSGRFLVKIPEEQMLHVWLIPVYTLGTFGLACLSIIIYRVYTFNNCEAAVKELQMQIKEGREDLTKKGFKFDEDKLESVDS
ncbi:dolichyl-phosphate mannosyltransferase subunit 3 isoform X1 [Tachypleus tridentatus]|uniref:dolichyl-phosphate mannosyltransferase subunit 3 isoform X1 n=1 Tax=Tachypleus tridentatus TaxID=6853 RepID=UPI003FD56BC9